MSRQPTHKERTQRAFRAYLDLLDAAERLKAALRGPIKLVDLTLEGFRLLEMLDREGALPFADVVRRRAKDRESTKDVIARMEKHGWVRRAIVKLPPVEFKQAHLPKSRRDEPREGRRIAVVGLTGSGKRFIGGVLTRYSKIVKAIMQGIGTREQESLSRICRKLREGDVLKFVREIRMEREED
jgi:MarR family transcriptional regulator, 2-MHQ and catechol-resistance regulon repressor